MSNHTNATAMPTASPTGGISQFDLLYENWSDSQHEIYGIKKACAMNALYAFVAVLTQFAVSQWIWSSSAKKSKGKSVHHNAPVYIVSSVVFALLWSMLMNGDSDLQIYDPLPIGFRIAVPVLATIGGVALNLLFCWIWSSIFNDNNDDETNENASDEEVEEIEPNDNAAVDAVVEAAELGERVPNQELQQVQIATPVATTPKKEKPKFHYITNIKIFLTGLVIVHHMADYGYVEPLDPSMPTMNTPLLGFVQVNESFFMSLFFFFSGYFSPRSLDKKGTYVFLLDKLKRLGIPAVIFTYLLGPYMRDGFMYLFFQKGEEEDTGFNPSLTSSGSTWFLLQLVLFNVVFALACGEGWNPKIRCPSLLSFFGISVLLGVLSGTMIFFFGDPLSSDGFFLPMPPNGWEILPSYVMFFLGGMLAQRNDWMNDIKNKSRLVIYSWAALSVAASMIAQIYVWNETFSFVFWGISVAVGIPLSLAVTVFFYDFANRNYAITPFLAKATYSAYLVQELFPNWAAIKCWLLILEAVGSNGQSGILIFVGFVFTSVLALVLNFTLGYALVSIPGFSQVL